MYINISTYGGIDWHDSFTVYLQLKVDDSYFIEEQAVPEVIANHIAKLFPYVEDIKEKVLCAIAEKSSFRFMIKKAEKDCAGNTTYKDCETHYGPDGGAWHENEATFDGKELTMTEDFAFGQVSYFSEYRVMDIPDESLGFIVTENFLAPTKGVPVVERLYHDIFDDQKAAEAYADNLKIHEYNSGFVSSVVNFLICNKDEVRQSEWYQLQKEAMELMAAKKQTHLNDSFSIFVKHHIENLNQLNQGCAA